VVRYVPVLVAAVAGIATPLFAVLLETAGFGRCIDTLTFLNPAPLVLGGIGVAVATASAALLGSGTRRAAGLTGLLAGSVLLALALLAPPYHGCGAFPIQVG
jgi:hypothetical protein